MNVELIIIAVIVAGAIAFLLRSWLTPRRKGSCDTGCGCEKTSKKPRPH